MEYFEKINVPTPVYHFNIRDDHLIICGIKNEYDLIDKKEIPRLRIPFAPINLLNSREEKVCIVTINDISYIDYKTSSYNNNEILVRRKLNIVIPYNSTTIMYDDFDNIYCHIFITDEENIMIIFTPDLIVIGLINLNEYDKHLSMIIFKDKLYMLTYKNSILVFKLTSDKWSKNKME